LCFLQISFKRIRGERKRWRKERSLGTDVGKQSYVAFLVHVPVLVVVQSGVNEARWSEWSAYKKAAHVNVIGIIKSWLSGWLLKESEDRIGFHKYL
jgi:peptidoglycan/LPS O-acetylase OafA/YrhL